MTIYKNKNKKKDFIYMGIILTLLVAGVGFSGSNQFNIPLGWVLDNFGNSVDQNQNGIIDDTDTLGGLTSSDIQAATVGNNFFTCSGSAAGPILCCGLTGDGEVICIEKYNSNLATFATFPTSAPVTPVTPVTPVASNYKVISNVPGNHNLDNICNAKLTGSHMGNFAEVSNCIYKGNCSGDFWINFVKNTKNCNGWTTNEEPDYANNMLTGATYLNPIDGQSCFTNRNVLCVKDSAGFNPTYVDIPPTNGDHNLNVNCPLYLPGSHMSSKIISGFWRTYQQSCQSWTADYNGVYGYVGNLQKECSQSYSVRCEI